MKTCPLCHRELPIEKFSWVNKAAGIHGPYCKQCLTRKSIEYYQRNRERRLQYHKEWAALHAETLRVYKYQYHQKNRNRLCRKATAWYVANKDRARVNAAIYMRKRRHSDVGFKLITNLRRRLRRILLGQVKTGSSIRDLGCSPTELRYYLEQRFLPGMTWENYGQIWYMDHIIPLSFFDLQNETEFKMAVRYQNLQPLWARENIQKGNRLGMGGSLSAFSTTTTT